MTVKATHAHGAAAPDAVRTFLYKKPTFTDAMLTKGVIAIKADHVGELRVMVNVVRKLEH